MTVQYINKTLTEHKKNVLHSNSEENLLWNIGPSIQMREDNMPIDEVTFPACDIIGIMQIGKKLRPVGLGVTRLAILLGGAIT